MKKLLLTALIALTLFGCSQAEDLVKEQFTPEYEKMATASDILEEILIHIADHDPKLSFDDGNLVDTELGIPRYEIVSLTEIDHFSPDAIAEGYVVSPVVEIDNPHLLIVAKANDKASASDLNDSMKKVLSDQATQFHGKSMSQIHLVNMNQIVRQGDYLIYATWEDADELVRVFERHVR